MLVPNGQFQNGGVVAVKKPAGSGSSDEDPYSLTPSGSSGSSGKEGTGGRTGGNAPAGRGKEKEYYPPQNWVQRGGVNDLSDDYIEEEMNVALKGRGGTRGQRFRNKKGEEKRERLGKSLYSTNLQNYKKMQNYSLRHSIPSSLICLFQMILTTMD